MKVKEQERKSLFFPQIKRNFSPHNSCMTLLTCLSIRANYTVFALSSKVAHRVTIKACNYQKIWDWIRMRFSPLFLESSLCAFSRIGIRSFVCILSKQCLSYVSRPFYTLYSTFTNVIFDFHNVVRQLWPRFYYNSYYNLPNLYYITEEFCLVSYKNSSPFSSEIHDHFCLQPFVLFNLNLYLLLSASSAPSATYSLTCAHLSLP